MASLLSSTPSLLASARVSRRPNRPALVVKAFASDSSNGKQSVEEINRLIGQRIKEAAAQIGTFRVWQANAAIGKYVKQAAEDAAAGTLKRKVAKR